MVSPRKTSSAWNLLFSAALWMLPGVPPAAAAGPFSNDRRADLKVFSSSDCYPDNLAAHDLNGDGRPDLTVTGFCKKFSVFFADNAAPPKEGRFLPARETRLPDSVIGLTVLPRPKGNPLLVFSNCANPDKIARIPRIQIVSSDDFKLIRDLPTGGKAPDDIAVADFNADGIRDLMIGHWMEGALTLLLGKDGEGNFTVPAAASPQRVSVGIEIWQVIPTDFNKDKKLDAAFVVWDNSKDGKMREASAAIMMGKGLAEFDKGTLQTFAVDPETRSLAAADFNGDGRMDLAVANPGSGLREDGSLLVLLGDGKGGFSPIRLGAAELGGGMMGPQGIAAADFDRDGRPDLALASRPVTQDGRLYILRNEGGGRFSLAKGQTLPLGPNTRVSNFSFRPVVSGDFNADGAPDLAVTNQPTNTVTVFYNTLK